MEPKIGTALVVGAGIGGIRSALDLAQSGYQVRLIDRAAHIGGVLTQLDVQFPTHGCGMCRMLPLLDRDNASQFCLRKGLFHPNIEIQTSTELSKVEGEAGHFTVRLRRHPTGVDPQACVGCGICTTVCPVAVPDAFNAGLGTHKAIYLPVPHAIPNAYVIDLNACTRCGACQGVCPAGAIHLPPDQRADFAILVVDDEPAMGDSLREWLLNEGYTSTTVADSGPAALEMLAASDYQLMLTDIKMPGMDGVELLKRAKEMRPDLTVVMMTAYATVETAVEAMKMGALDYLMKPFDPGALIPFIHRLHQELEASRDEEVNVNTIIIGNGTQPADPLEHSGLYGYGQMPDVVTSLELERLISGTGPGHGVLRRPSDGRPVTRIAWLQCVGSRNIQLNADFCASICCMISVKQARMVAERSPRPVESVIFYMDMRTYGKGFQEYLDTAMTHCGPQLRRARVHSIDPDPTTGSPLLRNVDQAGGIRQEPFDMVVLAMGQRPADGTRRLAQCIDAPTNAWGFWQAAPFAPVRSQRDGIFLSGTACGPQPIGDAVIQASAAAMEAAHTIHTSGGSLATVVADPMPDDALERELPRALVVICRCGERLEKCTDLATLEADLRRRTGAMEVIFTDALCTADGWQALEARIAESAFNRLLIGACHPYVFTRKLRKLAAGIGLPASLLDVVDLGHSRIGASPDTTPGPGMDSLHHELGMALARLRHADSFRPAGVPVSRQALVIGGGIAGLTAALFIADMGYPVHLVECSDQLGGNLHWIQETLDGHGVAPLLNETVDRVNTHPHIHVHLQAQVVDATGSVGRFTTYLAGEDGDVDTVAHGAVIIATGGGESLTDAYAHGTHAGILTQKALEVKLAQNQMDTDTLGSVVMIQCVGSREPGRPFCSRVCCMTALKQALKLKTLKPDMAVYVFYRDMMAYGFNETYFTRAREAGVIFIQYDPREKPAVAIHEDTLHVAAVDPILQRPLDISADMVVLATGVLPALPRALPAAFGIRHDDNGFFQEADPKWRPVEGLREGVFACGLSLAPYTIAESIATAQAAAQKVLQVLARDILPASLTTARVRQSLCALCERCIEACPVDARCLDAETRQIVVDPVLCQGCGACSAVCPNGAATVTNGARSRMFSVIEAALGN